MSKRKRDIPGYTLRSVAEQEYGRSKSSFIRDVDGAFERGDLKFLEHFRVYLNDGSMIPGTEATKEKMRSAQTLQPWVYIRTSLLETRYWEKSESKKVAAKAKSKKGVQSKEEGRRPIPKLKGVSDAVQLEHENAILRQELSSEKEKNTILEKNNTFFQKELESRRGELEEMTKFVDTVRLGIEAGKQKGEDRPTLDTTVVEAQVVKETEEGRASQAVDNEEPSQVIHVDDLGKGSTVETVKKGVQKFMDFINQPIGRGKKRSSSAPTNDK